MATISDLGTSLLDLSFDEAIELIKTLRRSRMVPKKTQKKRKASSSTTRKPRAKKKTMAEIIKSLSPEERKAIIAKLGG